MFPVENQSEILARYMSFLLSSKALKASTVERKVKALKSLLKHGVVLEPESVISFLNGVGWSSGTKDLVLDAFKDYLRMIGLSVKLPKSIVEKLPLLYVPCLLARKLLAAYLSVL